MSGLSKENFDANKDDIVGWIKGKLEETTGEQDADLVDYVTIMLSNGKNASDVGTDLEALVGEEISSVFAAGLDEYLITMNATLSNSGDATTKTAASKVVSLKSRLGPLGSAALSVALSSGRDRTSSAPNNNNNTGKKRSLADSGALGGVLSSSRGGAGSRDSYNNSRDRDQGGMAGSNNRNNNNNNNNRNNNSNNNNNSRNNQVGNNKGKIERDNNGGFVTNKKGRGENGPVAQQQPAGDSQVDQLAQMSGFKSAQEMIVFQQQQLMVMMQQQPQGQFGGRGGFQHGRGAPFRGGRGGRGASPRGSWAPPPPPGAARAPAEGNAPASSDETSAPVAPVDGADAPASALAGAPALGGAPFGGRGRGGYQGRGGRGFNPHAVPYEPSAYAGRGRGAGRGFDPSVAAGSAPFAGAGRGGRGRGGRGFAGFGGRTGNIFGFANSATGGSDGANTEAALNTALSAPPVGTAFPSKHKTWVREDVTTASAATPSDTA